MLRLARRTFAWLRLFNFLFTKRKILDATKEDFLRAIKLDIWRRETTLVDYQKYVHFLEQTMKMLAPVSIQGRSLVRLGNKNDGGYVLLDDIKYSLISIGTGRETSFDHEFCLMNQKVFQFDHTIQSAPKCCNNPRFFQLGLRAVNSEQNPKLLTLDEIVSMCIGDESLTSILKMDVEGSEIGVLEEFETENLIRRFRQIVVEVHNLELSYTESQRIRLGRVFKALASHFYVVNYHANNFTKLLVEGNVVVPSTFELTLANKELYRASGNQYGLDSVNKPNNPKFLDTELHLFNRHTHEEV